MGVESAGVEVNGGKLTKRSETAWCTRRGRHRGQCEERSRAANLMSTLQLFAKVSYVSIEPPWLGIPLCNSSPSNPLSFGKFWPCMVGQKQFI